VCGSLLAAAVVVGSGWSARAEDPVDYRSPETILQVTKSLADAHGELLQRRILGHSPGGRDLVLLELGHADSQAPAVLVVANMEGNCPIATEAAMKLTELLLTDWSAELDKHRWYIHPMGNPDGYAKFFSRPLFADFVNDRPRNDDLDDATDEDGPEDLNGDGFITMMRQEHPEGTWIAVEDHPVLMKKAKASEGERGKYRMFTEGIDNDGDGEINEDAPGGASPGRNFPHNFEHYTREGGRWAASEPETRFLLRFAFDHPEIAMVLTFGRSNSLKDVPQGSKKTEAAQDKYKVPERMAKRMGIDPDKEFPLKELVEMARDMTGYRELTEEMVLMFLGVGAAVNPDKGDIPYWTDISKKYNDFMKEAGFEEKRLDPPAFSPGCVEEWAYYQYGVPSFSMDFWTLPAKKEEKKEGGGDDLTPDKIEKMSNEDFIALGKEKIEAFLKANDAPPQFGADMVINALKGGMMNTKRMAAFIRKAAKKKEAGGADETEDALYAFDPEAFVVWQPFDHPTLGKVEIGGKIPYRDLTPPAGAVAELLDKQLPFARTLAGMLPSVAIEKVDVEPVSSGIWRVDAWIANQGFLPYPTHQGNRCKRPTPAVVTLSADADKLLEGKPRIVLGVLEGTSATKKLSWLVRATEGTELTLAAESFSAGRDARTITLDGGSN